MGDPPLIIPPELLAVPQDVLKDFLAAFSRRIVTAAAPALSSDEAVEAFKAVYAAMHPGSAQQGGELRLEFRHSCKFTGCTRRSCELCKNNPNKVCDHAHSLDQQYWVRDDGKGGQLVKAKCGADIELQILRGHHHQPLYMPDIKVKLYVINGQLPACPSPFEPAGGLFLSDEGRPLFAAADMVPEDDGGLPLMLVQDNVLGPAWRAPDLQFLDKNSKFRVDGRLVKSFKFMARAFQRDPVTGQDVVVAQVDSDAFKVTTKKGYDGCRKAEYLFSHEAITDKTFANLGETTVNNLKSTFPGVGTVEDLRQLVQRCSSEPAVEKQLREVLNMGRDKDKWRNFTRVLQDKVLTEDSVPRLWWLPSAHAAAPPASGVSSSSSSATGGIGLLWQAHKGQVDFSSPTGVVPQQAAPGGKMQVCPISDAGRAAAGVQLAQLQQLAASSWQLRHHPGWSTVQQDLEWTSLEPQQLHAAASSALAGQPDPLTRLAAPQQGSGDHHSSSGTHNSAHLATSGSPSTACLGHHTPAVAAAVVQGHVSGGAAGPGVGVGLGPPPPARRSHHSPFLAGPSTGNASTMGWVPGAAAAAAPPPPPGAGAHGFWSPAAHQQHITGPVGGAPHAQGPPRGPHLPRSVTIGGSAAQGDNRGSSAVPVGAGGGPVPIPNVASKGAQRLALRSLTMPSGGSAGHGWDPMQQGSTPPHTPAAAASAGPLPAQPGCAAAGLHPLLQTGNNWQPAPQQQQFQQQQVQQQQVLAQLAPPPIWVPQPVSAAAAAGVQMVPMSPAGQLQPLLSPTHQQQQGQGQHGWVVSGGIPGATLLSPHAPQQLLPPASTAGDLYPPQLLPQPGQTQPSLTIDQQLVLPGVPLQPLPGALSSQHPQVLAPAVPMQMQQAPAAPQQLVAAGTAALVGDRMGSSTLSSSELPAEVAGLTTGVLEGCRSALDAISTAVATSQQPLPDSVLRLQQALQQQWPVADVHRLLRTFSDADLALLLGIIKGSQQQQQQQQAVDSLPPAVAPLQLPTQQQQGTGVLTPGSAADAVNSLLGDMLLVTPHSGGADVMAPPQWAGPLRQQGSATASQGPPIGPLDSFGGNLAALPDLLANLHGESHSGSADWIPDLDTPGLQQRQQQQQVPVPQQQQQPQGVSQMLGVKRERSAATAQHAQHAPPMRGLQELLGGPGSFVLDSLDDSFLLRDVAGSSFGRHLPTARLRSSTQDVTQRPGRSARSGASLGGIMEDMGEPGAGIGPVAVAAAPGDIGGGGLGGGGPFDSPDADHFMQLGLGDGLHSNLEFDLGFDPAADLTKATLGELGDLPARARSTTRGLGIGNWASDMFGLNSPSANAGFPLAPGATLSGDSIGVRSGSSGRFSWLAGLFGRNGSGSLTRSANSANQGAVAGGGGGSGSGGSGGVVDNLWQPRAC